MLLCQHIVFTCFIFIDIQVLLEQGVSDLPDCPVMAPVPTFLISLVMPVFHLLVPMYVHGCSAFVILYNMTTCKN